MTSMQKRRAVLLSRLAELDERLHRIESELEEQPDPDWDDMAIEREGDEVMQQLGLSGQGEILRIRAALKRLREGSYGLCTRCDDIITAERLDVLPDTPLCKNCAAELG